MKKRSLISKILFRLKYPKLIILITTFYLAYKLYSSNSLPFQDQIINSGYAGALLAGVFFAYGFTAAPATAVLLLLAKTQNILFTGLIAGFGALVGDIFIFKFIRLGFTDEIEKLSKEKIVKRVRKKIPDFLEFYFLPVLASFLIATPLPDEIGVALLASTRQISTRVFSMISFTLNTIGIFIILIIGKSL